MRQTTNNSKLAADGGQIVKMHLETYYPHWKGIERLFTWKQSSEPVQRTSLVRLPVTGIRRPYPIPNLAGSKAAVVRAQGQEKEVYWGGGDDNNNGRGREHLVDYCG